MKSTTSSGSPKYSLSPVDARAPDSRAPSARRARAARNVRIVEVASSRPSRSWPRNMLRQHEMVADDRDCLGHTRPLVCLRDSHRAPDRPQRLRAPTCRTGNSLVVDRGEAAVGAARLRQAAASTHSPTQRVHGSGTGRRRPRRSSPRRPRPPPRARWCGCRRPARRPGSCAAPGCARRRR